MSKDSEADVEFIRALAELIRESDLTEIEVEREYGEGQELKVRLSRAVTMTAAPVQIAAPATAPAASSAPAPAPAQGAAPAQPAAPEDPADHPGAVTSPMVGTVYMAAEPGGPAFVKVGDTVEEGDTLLIIEAMKTMNQIPAPRGGTVKRILVENAAPVEYGAPLMIIE